MLSVVYAVLLTLGNLDNLTPQGQWRELAAPWLGEPPAGLQVETIRAGNFGDCPATVFSLPANEELRRRIIETYRLDPAGTTAAGEEKFGNKHVLPDYTDDTRPVLPGLSVCISPWLVVEPDKWEFGEPQASQIPIPHALARGISYMPLACISCTAIAVLSYRCSQRYLHTCDSKYFIERSDWLPLH